MNRVLSIVSLVVFTVLLAVTPACAQEDGDKPVTIPQPLKEWTFAVFLNADNNLDPFGVEDQVEMSKIGSSNWLNIVTLIDRERGPAQWNYIEKGKVTKVKDMGELDMGDYKQFIDFVKFVKTNFPAKKYMIGIWNHGSGWKAAGKIVRGVSYDDSTGNHITTNQLVGALGEAKKILGKNIDILNFDCCLMQMAEVVYACKDSCDYIVASEETEPGKGTPYD
ncbi:MAG TPA: clostripain-related cysteine peptidase, partial [Candidatus Ozemobacteraceae bacterium]|nr:clostripain-related cysteine peptidase [Candidatus Ozemobacteraceae bacterium]